MLEAIEASPITTEYINKAKELTGILSTSTCVERVIVWGSTVKGLAGKDSDIDMIVLVSGSLNTRIRYTEEVFDTLEQQGHRVALYFNERNFKGPRGGSIHLGVLGGEESLPNDALTQGIVLFDRRR